MRRGEARGEVHERMLFSAAAPQDRFRASQAAGFLANVMDMQRIRPAVATKKLLHSFCLDRRHKHRTRALEGLWRGTRKPGDRARKNGESLRGMC